MEWYAKMPEDYKSEKDRGRHRLRRKNRGEKQIANEKKEREWCEHYGLNHKALREAHIMIDDTLRRLCTLGYHLSGEFDSVRSDLTKGCERKVEYYHDILKVIIGAACYPHFYKIEQNMTEAMLLSQFQMFNPLTTVQFKIPENQGYSVGKGLFNKMRPCGKVNRMYFIKQEGADSVFVEFKSDGELELFEQYDFHYRHYSQVSKIMVRII